MHNSEYFPRPSLSERGLAESRHLHVRWQQRHPQKKKREHTSMHDVTLKALRFHAAESFTYQGPSIDSSKKGVA